MFEDDSDDEDAKDLSYRRAQISSNTKELTQFSLHSLRSSSTTFVEDNQEDYETQAKHQRSFSSNHSETTESAASDAWTVPEPTHKGATKSELLLQYCFPPHVTDPELALSHKQWRSLNSLVKTIMETTLIDAWVEPEKPGHPKYSTGPCHNHFARGHCRWGKRCRHTHNRIACVAWYAECVIKTFESSRRVPLDINKHSNRAPCSYWSRLNSCRVDGCGGPLSQWEHDLGIHRYMAKKVVKTRWNAGEKTHHGDLLRLLNLL